VKCWRWWLVPGNFLAALVLFCLPWVEIRCDKNAQSRPPRPPEFETVWTQSGLQAVWGGYTDLRPKSERPTNSDGDDDISPAPLVAVYGVLLVLAFLVALLARGRPHVWAAVAGMAGVAFLLLTLQALVGFPIERMFDEKKGDWRVGWSSGWVHYTWWYYLSIALMVAGVTLSLMEWRRLILLRARSAREGNLGVEASQ
jgi:hypothetical protein